MSLSGRMPPHCVVRYRVQAIRRWENQTNSLRFPAGSVRARVACSLSRQDEHHIVLELTLS